MSGAHILLVDDDRAILAGVRRSLEANGYAVDCLDRGTPVAQRVTSDRPDVVLLDLGLPDIDGLEVCRAIRAASAVPIIVLSASGDDARKVQALDEGADDYLTKPFSLAELQARIRVALRHAAGGQREALLTVGPIVIDLERRDVRIDGVEVRLTPKEFGVLRMLAQGQGRLLTHRLILSEVWGPEYSDDRHVLRTFVHQLRTKLDATLPGAGSWIVTDSGVGYRLVIPES